VTIRRDPALLEREREDRRRIQLCAHPLGWHEHDPGDWWCMGNQDTPEVSVLCGQVSRDDDGRYVRCEETVPCWEHE